MSRYVRTSVALAAALTLLSACGQKGPLTLPTPATAAKPPSSSPAASAPEARR